jgi:hypothetical protein
MKLTKLKMTLKKWRALIIISLILLCIAGCIFPSFLPQLNLAILVLTLGTLIWYTYDTNRIANQTQENSLRPVILRSGFIDNWESIKFNDEANGKVTGKLIQFTILKNIAKDIEGYIVINGKYHELFFGNDISKIEDGSITMIKKWGWMRPDTTIYADFTGLGKNSKLKNRIYIKYRDMSNNTYYTLEDEGFNQTSSNM